MNKIRYFIKQIRKISSDKQKRAIFSLIVMFLFCFLLILSARSGKSYNSVTTEVNDKQSLNFSVSNIEYGNYHFVYTINTDNNEVKYEGNNYNNKALFNDLEGNYLLYGNTYFKDFNGVWSKTEVSDLFKFTNISNIKNILEESMLDNKTEYSNKESIFNYSVTTSTIDKIINDLDTDIADELNTISITTSSDNEVYKIVFNLTPYSMYKYNTSTMITLEYSEFGAIEEIKDIE